ARDLRPPALDQLGLVPALSSLLADVEAEDGLAAELEVNGDTVRLPPEVELGAFRITQEAVRNTLRHAQAREVHVSLRFEPGTMTLVVVDDGRGFEPVDVDELASDGHLGLLGMAERVHLLGGQLTVRSAPGEGTVTEAMIPLGP
ncbi:sensor histidine kinase, partial [Metallibacterium scheffleri]|uniref:sensor histidine kinase n=1 Tax=Metallibacterium scheffleri TaxID=993689 RepID=UPI0023EF8DAC